MGKTTEVTVPDIGEFSDVPVVDVLVKSGDRVNPEDPLVTLESDKAAMDVPSPHKGVVRELRIDVGDKVSEGSVLLTLELDDEAGQTREAEEAGAGAPAESAAAEEPEAAGARDKTEEKPPPRRSEKQAPAGAGARTEEVRVPDIGDFDDVPVVAVLVRAGDRVAAEDPLITLESDKAAMDVPAPATGTVRDVHVSEGDKVSEGSLILSLEVSEEAAAREAEEGEAPAREAPAREAEEHEAPARETEQAAPESEAPRRSPAHDFEPEAISPGTPERAEPAVGGLPLAEELIKARSHATPAVRRLAREMGVDLTQVKGTGRKGRILKDDLKRYVKEQMERPATPGGLGIPEMPAIDFSKFGPVETRRLTRIQRRSGPNVHRSWLHVPHVTQHDEADITELEAFRKAQGEAAKSHGVRLTLLAFLMKASVAALQRYPSVNASLDPNGESLILKKYYHLGIAVDTPDGLVVPVIRDVDRKGLYELAEELGTVSAKARDKKLTPGEMQGASFTISSLGGIGGTAFTPIVNAPEVAILGVSRAAMKPVYVNGEFEPRLMLPFALSYDHRVIDGAAAARFTTYLAELLSDIRRLLL